MQTPPFSLDQLVAEVVRLATKHSRRRYRKHTDTADGPACRYRLTRHPITHRSQRCIIGQAMFNLGVPDSLLPEKGDATSVLSALFPLDQDTRIAFLHSIQSQQDNHQSWGAALKHARHIWKGVA